MVISGHMRRWIDTALRCMTEISTTVRARRHFSRGLAGEASSRRYWTNRYQQGEVLKLSRDTVPQRLQDRRDRDVGEEARTRNRY
ncbi:hypothetical protein I7I50_07576 [Histoplasma capsulatum G186AR]|uniref:Uncharacterized protein n=1 Tax=Ajellomyces capsulatus TaxID=5037 RepID=A0A8H8D2C3_AJECA|nr:hypothetical protein I7I52_09352 [Histoplasma capsulatum]QSS68234.1 hypothetical protein I7I50_07576 [Histoplasma capsulatum G186AR]